MRMGKIVRMKVIESVHEIKRMRKVCLMLGLGAKRGSYPVCTGDQMAACRLV